MSERGKTNTQGARLEVITSFNHSDLVSRYVRNVAPYDAVSSLEKIRQRSQITHYKLDWNESTQSPSTKVYQALKEYLETANGLNWYPPLFSNDLREKLALYVGSEKDNILVTNGSDDSLELIMKTFLDPGDSLVTQYPTYQHALLFARSRGANIVKVVYPDVFEADHKKLIAAIDKSTKLVYIVNPNNPTGAFLGKQELEEVVNAAPNALVLVDEAYYEFCGESAVPLVQKYENVIVTRSFSKAFALAGMRIGYLVASSGIVRQLTRIFNPKSVNTLAQVAASATLDDLGYYDSYVKEVNLAKDMVAQFCAERGLEFRSTRANYVLIKVPHVHRVIKDLEREGVYVRDRSSIPQLRGFFRFNLGTRQQTEVILKRMDKVFTRLGITKKESTN